LIVYPFTGPKSCASLEFPLIIAPSPGQLSSAPPSVRKGIGSPHWAFCLGVFLALADSTCPSVKTAYLLDSHLVRNQPGLEAAFRRADL
jgi:hypothetical protein